jgi:hypothetical protein
MKGPGAKNDLRRILYSRGCIALFIMVFGSGFPTAYAEIFKFESKTGLQSYTATIGGELSLPPGRGPFPVVILLHACGGLDPTGKASLSAHAQSLTKVHAASRLTKSVIEVEKPASLGSMISLTPGKPCGNIRR